MANDKRTARYLLPLLAAPLVLLCTILLPPPLAGLSVPAWHTAGLATMMAIWWVTEAVPIPVTSLLPMILAPLLGIADLKTATAAFAHPLIFLFLGGFLLSIGMERWNLHKRIALLAMTLVGNRPSRQIAGMMSVTAFLSMWMSNTATAVMMLPIGLSVIGLMQEQHSQREESAPFAKSLLLAIAYSASIGGLGTLIGTPPNALLAAYLSDSYNIHLGFSEWMLLGVPLSLVMLVAAWFWLTHLQFKVNACQLPDTGALFKERLQALGPVSRGERMILILFIITALCWIFRPLLSKFTGLAISDTGIAMLAASLLFILPVDVKSGQRLLAWEDAKQIPWGVLLLFGGGLSLAAAIKGSGLADFIGHQVSHTQGMPILVVILVVVTLIIFLTEITSNTATTAGFLPLLGPIAVAMSLSPAALAIPAALAASCAFMMPVATPPNAVVFGSGELRIPEMIRAGFMLNLVGIVVIALFTVTLGGYLYQF